MTGPLGPEVMEARVVQRFSGALINREGFSRADGCLCSGIYIAKRYYINFLSDQPAPEHPENRQRRVPV